MKLLPDPVLDANTLRTVIFTRHYGAPGLLEPLAASAVRVPAEVYHCDEDLPLDDR